MTFPVINFLGLVITQLMTGENMFSSLYITPGILLGTVFFAPGGIWAAWGAHLGWNLSLAALGAPVSGLPLAIPALEYSPGGPGWLSGGAFGPEGGILASVAMIGAIAVAIRWIPKGEGTA